MRRLILFVEGDGEAEAVPTLVRRLISEKGGWQDLILDNDPFRVGNVSRLVKDNYREWKNKLKACLKRSSVGGVLLILDGDVKKVSGNAFCAAYTARSLAAAAAEVGAGRMFSVAIVFALQEYETWLIAGVASLAGQALADGRHVKLGVTPPEGNLELSPRDAKGWLDDIIERGYKPTRDQARLTNMVSLEAIRSCNLRSFRRLEFAVSGLLTAIQSNKPRVSPS